MIEGKDLRGRTAAKIAEEGKRPSPKEVEGLIHGDQLCIRGLCKFLNWGSPDVMQFFTLPSASVVPLACLGLK